MSATSDPLAAAAVRTGAAVALLLLAAAAPAAAQTHSWNHDSPGNWSQPLQWTPNGVPNAPGHWAAIGVSSGTPYTVTLDMDAVLDQFSFGAGNATFAASGRTLTVNGASVLSGSWIDWTHSAWVGPGTIQNQSTHFRARGSSTLGNMSNDGLLDLLGSNNGGNSNLTITGAVSNSDTVRLNSEDSSYASALHISGPQFVNNATFESLAGAGGGRSVNGPFLNSGIGSTRLEASTVFSGGPVVNQGAWEVQSGAAQTFGSGVRFENSGPLTVDGSFQLGSGTFSWIGGPVAGTVALTHSTLELGAGNTDSGLFQVEGSSAVSGDLRSLQQVRVQGNSRGGNAALSPASSFQSAGVLRLEAADSTYAASLNLTPGDAFTNLSGGALQIYQGSGGGRNLVGAFDNQGLVDMQWPATFSTGPFTSTGVFNIGPAAVLNFGSNVGFRVDGGVLDIQGAFQMSSGTLDLDGGAVTGVPELTHSTLNVLSGYGAPVEVLIEGSSVLNGPLLAGHTVQGQGSSRGGNSNLSCPGGLTSAGTLLLDARDSTYASNLTMGTGPLQNAGTLRFAAGPGGGARGFTGELVNSGQVHADTSATWWTGPFTNHADLSVASGAVLTLASGTSFVQDGGSLQLDGALQQSSGSFQLDGGTMTGVPELTHAALGLGPGFTAPAEVLVEGSSSLSGAVSAGQTVHGQGSSRGGNSTLTAAAGLDNAGDLLFDSRDSSYSSALVVAGGPLSNTGTVRFAAGPGGGARSFGGELINQGLFAVDTGLTMNTGPFANQADFRVAAGQALTVSSGLQFTQEAGTLQCDGSFLLSSGTLRLAGGTTAGALAATHSALEIDPAFAGACEVEMEGNSTLGGGLQAGQAVVVRGAARGGQATLTASAGLISSGVLRLDSRDSGYQAKLVVNGGPFANQGLLEAAVGAGGVRNVTADLQNAGTIRVRDGASLAFSGTGLTNLAAGRLEGEGDLDVTAVGGLANNGAVAPGLDGVGSLSLTGDLGCGPDAILEVELGGFAPGTDHDQLSVSGTFAADGTLAVVALPGHTPQIGDQYTVATAGSLVGRFRTIETAGFPPLHGVRPRIQGGALVLTVVWDAPQPGNKPFRLGLQPPDPGLAGQDNDFVVLAAGQGKTVQLLYGSAAGHTTVPNCPGLSLGIDNAQLLGSGEGGGAQGRATITVSVPASFSGQTLLFQALEASTCRVSNVVSYSFP